MAIHVQAFIDELQVQIEADELNRLQEANDFLKDKFHTFCSNTELCFILSHGNFERYQGYPVTMCDVWLNVPCKKSISLLKRNWGLLTIRQRVCARMKIDQYEHVRHVTRTYWNKIRRLAPLVGRLRPMLIAWYNTYAYAPGGSKAPSLAGMQAHALALDRYAKPSHWNSTAATQSPDTLHHAQNYPNISN